MNNVNDRDYYEMERMVAEDVSMLSGKKLSFAEIILSFVPKERISSLFLGLIDGKHGCRVCTL